MNRTKLKKITPNRPKAFLGIGETAADLAIAGAIMASSVANTVATAKAADTQAKSVLEQGKIQTKALEEQNKNNIELANKTNDINKEEGQKNRQLQQDMNMTLQAGLGVENTNDRRESTKQMVKFGGKAKRKSIKSQPSYGGGRPFKVTDGGEAIPVVVDSDNYGLYELYGNDHEHYHKAQGGKYKSGVGVKFEDGTIVEGEGNQNSNLGELLYVTPNDKYFISKHNIAGFNPAKAVYSGMNPKEAFDIQETLKAVHGYRDDGRKVKHRSMKAFLGGTLPAFNMTSMPQTEPNGDAGVAVAKTKYNSLNTLLKRLPKFSSFNIPKIDINNLIGTNANQQIPMEQNTRSLAKCGKVVRSKKIAGGNWFKDQWNNNRGAVYNTIGNVGGTVISSIGNTIASNKLAKAYGEAGDMIANAYLQRSGIDLSNIKEDDFAAESSMAAIRNADTNINPMLERINRDAASETRNINRNSISSAARLNRLASTNDRRQQRVTEQYANKHNIDEQIKQGNAERITQVAQANADRKTQARRNYTDTLLKGMMYNNDIRNENIIGAAQARSDASLQGSTIKANTLQSNLGAFGSALINTGNAFASSWDAERNNKFNLFSTMAGADRSSQIAMMGLMSDDPAMQKYALSMYNTLRNGTTIQRKQAEQINSIFNFNNTKGLNNVNIRGNYLNKVTPINPNSAILKRR